jgi:hypothetical protein
MYNYITYRQNKKRLIDDRLNIMINNLIQNEYYIFEIDTINKCMISGIYDNITNNCINLTNCSIVYFNTRFYDHTSEKCILSTSSINNVIDIDEILSEYMPKDLVNIIYKYI